MSFKGLVAEMSSKQQIDSSPNSGALIPRPQNCEPAFAAERARIMFGCYRKGDANDPETYMLAITAILMEYKEETVMHVTDPRMGLPRKSNFLPTVAEVDKACADHANFCRSRDQLMAKGWRHIDGKWQPPERAA